MNVTKASINVCLFNLSAHVPVETMSMLKEERAITEKTEKIWNIVKKTLITSKYGKIVID
jgi:hypothetical protein